MRIAAIVMTSLVALGAEGQSPRVSRATESNEPGQVVFVCEHGSAKSLMAREWFDKLAAARGLSVRAASRGLTPDERVPPPIAAELARDGFDVAAFQPRKLSPTDAAGASVVVGIGIDIPSFPGAKQPAVVKWDGIPPASEGYSATRDALRDRIEKLLDELVTAKKAK